MVPNVGEGVRPTPLFTGATDGDASGDPGGFVGDDPLLSPSFILPMVGAAVGLGSLGVTGADEWRPLGVAGVKEGKPFCNAGIVVGEDSVLSPSWTLPNDGARVEPIPLFAAIGANEGLSDGAPEGDSDGSVLGRDAVGVVVCAGAALSLSETGAAED